MRVTCDWFWLEFVYGRPCWSGYETGVIFSFGPTRSKIEGWPLFNHTWRDTFISERRELTP